MGDADTKTSNNSSTTPAVDEDSSTTTECSKKQKLNGGDEPPCSNNNANAAATAADADTTTATPPPPAESEDLSTEAAEEEPKPPPEEDNQVKYKVQVMYNKNPIQMEVTANMTVLQLKEKIKAQTGVDPHLQKVLLKGIAKDDQRLGDLGVGPGTKKILVIGSSIQDVLKVTEVPDTSGSSGGGNEGGGEATGGNWCSLQSHKKVIDKGLPEDTMPGILDEHDPLPPFPLHGMYSSKGSKVRLTFKLENDELWIGTKERTEKVPISTIRNVTSQPITGYEHYHIVAIQLGPTEASRFFVYWVPAQYVEAIKDALTGA